MLNEKTTSPAFDQEDIILNKAIDFLSQIGLQVHFRNIGGPCFLPGLSITAGEIVVDLEQLKYPGDILHEAGHLAVVPAVERKELNATAIEKRPMREAEEMMAIAWSYAACVHLDINPRFVFHDEGYKNGGSHIAENFEQGHYFGVPMLQWTGMALEKIKEDEPEKPVYPAMLKWLRD